MTFDIERVYTLLPAIYRIRDIEHGTPQYGGPLKALLTVIVEQIGVLEDDLAQLYDDHFIETCAEWAIPYIGDLIGLRHVRAIDDLAGRRGLTSIGQVTLSERAEVANTVGYRRRKGTVALLEPLARDVTGWYARAVEYFSLVAMTQYVSAIRPENHVLDLRHRAALQRLDTPFETLHHTVDVRGIARDHGRYNLPDIGIFIWRLTAYPLTASPAVQHGEDGRRYRFSPLGNDTPLFTRPRREDEIGRFTHPVEPIDLPMPLTRHAMQQRLGDYYGRGNSVVLTVDGQDVSPNQIMVADLSDGANGAWAHQPHDRLAIDPELGRIAFPESQPTPSDVRASFHYGFSANIGGGEYDRGDWPQPASPLSHQQPTTIEVGGGASIQAALGALHGDGVIEITDSGRYEERLVITAAPNQRLVVRAVQLHRPTIMAHGDLVVTGGAGADITLDGLLIGGQIYVSGELRRFRLRHCTLVPGLTLSQHGEPQRPDEPSLIVIAPGADVEILYSIVGGVRVVASASTRITTSIVDATAEHRVAYAAPDAPSPGASLSIDNSTVIGTVHAMSIAVATNTIFLAHHRERGDRGAAVSVERRQSGCVRFSYVPPGSRVPSCYRCQPLSDQHGAYMRPHFTSTRYGTPGYGQLSLHCPLAIRQGAEDESEMGAFHDLYQPQRETNLHVRLNEYLRFDLEAGVFYET